MAGDKKQITRNRTSYSCQTCRRRKVRCDKQHPRCGNCTKAGEVCIYGDSEKADSTARSNSIDLGRKRRATDNDGSEDSDVQGPSSAFQSIEQKLSQLTDLVRDVNRMTPISIGNSPDGRHLHIHSLSRQDSFAGNDLVGAHFKNGINNTDIQNGSSRHDGSWEQVLGKLEQLNVLLKAGLRAQIAPVPLEASGGSFSRPRPSARGDPSRLNSSEFHIHTRRFNGLEADARAWQAPSATDMLAPSGEESTVLFRSWLWSVYPILPIVSPAVVFRKYQAFNQWYVRGLDKGEPNPDPDFMPFVVLIWYSGYKSLTDRGKQRWFSWALKTKKWMPRLHTVLEHYLEVIKIEAIPSIYSLAAAISCHALAIGGQDIMSNHMRNTLNLRAVQSLGVHSERTLKDLSIPEAEMRRRIWWEALSMDTSISTVSGMPVVLDESYTDTKMISDLKESCMGTQDATEYEAHLEEPGSSPDRPDDPANWHTSSLVSVYHLVARARYLLTVATKKVLKANMSASPMKMDELKQVRKSMQQVGDEVRKIINRIQTRGIPELDFVPEMTPPSEVDHLDSMGEDITLGEINYFLREGSNASGTSPIMKHHRSMTIAFHKWARIMLSMCIDRLDCISYAPFLKNSKSRLWAVARNCALRSCHAYMRKFLCLAEDPELRMFRWAWTSSFHPMHATIIMLIDVHDRPHSDEASRSRAMIDKMFSLISPINIMAYPQLAADEVLPLKEGGEEAWSMLRKLRHKAWQNAGLDPDVLWTEEDQLSVGVGKALHENDLFIRSLREDIISKHKQRKERENGLLSNDHDQGFHNVSYEAARTQRLHPSEVGQGHQISGPVVREVADFDSISMVPQILLLRARNDQELMPYPVMVRVPDNTAVQNGENHEAAKDSTDQDNAGARVFHIGELIQKIQKTQRANKANKANSTKPVTQTCTSLPSQPVPPATVSEAPLACDFRTMRSVENAAYQEICEGHTTQSMLQVADINSQMPSSEAEHSASYDLFPGNSHGYTTVDSNVNQGDRPLVLRNQSYSQGNPDESLSLVSNIPPTLHNQGFTRSKPEVSVRAYYATVFETQRSQGLEGQQQQQQQQQQEQQQQPATPIPQAPPTQTTISMVDNPTANDTMDIGTAMDIEFDWNRWDEMFGQFAGFADMLVDVNGADFGAGDLDFGAELH